MEDNCIVPENFDNIKEQLSLQRGGKVTLNKNLETGVAFMCFDHPEKKNAISGEMAIHLRNCIEELEQWKEGKAVILYGTGNNFCSGGDLDCEKANISQQGGLNLITWMHDALNRLQKLPMISVCIIQGPTLGGGTEISVTCDYIIAADTAKFGLVHGVMGLSPGWGGGLKLVQKIGQKKSLDILLTSKILSAEQCVDYGIAEMVVPSENALEKTMEWLLPRIRHHHTVVRSMKKLILNTYLYTYDEVLEREKYIMLSLWGKEANLDALSGKIKHKHVSTSPFYGQINTTDINIHETNDGPIVLNSSASSSRIITTHTTNYFEKILSIFPRKESTNGEEIDTDRIIFPPDFEAISKLPLGDKPADCSGEIGSFCENVTTYPYATLNRILGSAYQKNDFFGVDENPPEISNRVAQDDEIALCGSVTKTIFPQAGENVKKKWRYIVNQGSSNDYSQGVITETCIRPNSICNHIEQVPLGFVSYCKQKYIYRRLLIIDENENVVPDTFSIPTSCCCEFKKDFRILQKRGSR